MTNNKFERRKNREKNLARLHCGLSQMFYQPLKNLIWIMILCMFSMVWHYKTKLVEWMEVPEVLQRGLESSLSLVLIVCLILSLLEVLFVLGELQGAEDEANLASAFRKSGLGEDDYAFLWSKKRQRRGEIILTVREFYSLVPKNKWEDMKEAIQDRMDITLVKPEITYGGVDKNRGRRIIIYSIAGRVQKPRGTMYDPKL